MLENKIIKKIPSLKHHKPKLLLLEFSLIFLLMAAPLYYILNNQIPLYTIEEGITKIVRPMLEISGIKTNETIGIDENGLKMPIIQMEPFPTGVGISRACTGYRSILALTALILATPLIQFKKKIKPILTGLSLFFIINIIRVYTTLLITNKIGLYIFNITHTLLWREGLIVAIIIIWYYWLRTIHYKKEVQKWMKNE